jgi:hypothetical protein
MRKKSIVFLILSGLLTFCKGDNSPWIWEIEGTKYTLNDFNDAYENYISLMAQQLQLTPEQLRAVIKNPEKSGLPKENLEMIKRLSKENFPEQYKQLLLLNTEAKKTGYLKKKEIQSRVNFIQQFYIASLYMAEKGEVGSADISDEEALSAWEVIRNSDARYRSVPIDQGIAVTKQRLAMKKAFENQQELIREIMEVYTIKNNPDFKLKEHIKDESEEKTESKEVK